MQQKQATWKIGGKYGLYTALMILFFYFIVNMSGLGMTQILNVVAYLILGVEIFFAQKAYRKAHRGIMSFGRGLKVGLLVSLVCGLVLGTLSFLYLKLINGEMLQTIIEQYRLALEAEGLTPVFIQELMNTVQAVLTPGGLFFLTLFVLLFSGLILSLIVTVFNKRIA